MTCITQLDYGDLLVPEWWVKIAEERACYTTADLICRWLDEWLIRVTPKELKGKTAEKVLGWILCEQHKRIAAGSKERHWIIRVNVHDVDFAIRRRLADCKRGAIAPLPWGRMK